MTSVSRVLAVLGFALVAWVLLTELPAVAHGHPAYLVMLVLTLLGCAWALWLHRTRREPVRGWRRVGSVALALGAVGWLAAIFYAKPFSAEEPALTAMRADTTIQVDETPTRVVMEPVGGSSATGVFFQPGAKVEARAYAAVLRPLAEAGHTVVIVKQPLGIAFLALGAFDDARSEHPEVSRWVPGGHSLGGTVAAQQADEADSESLSPAAGLLLFASYPGSDISETLTASVLSISGSQDGLATPDDIEASRANLPGDSRFLVIQGATHAFFGDYGQQPGDGEPTISHDQARTRISDASVAFVAEVAGVPAG